jgi:hypothetical protein
MTDTIDQTGRIAGAGETTPEAPPAIEQPPRPVLTTAELIGQCQGLVRSLARQIYLTLPPSAELEDLSGYGQLGLAEAARVFNPFGSV